MLRFLYTLLFYLMVPLVIVKLLWRSRKAPAYGKRWGERFGFVPAIATNRQVIWVHSVSVGETMAAVPMIKQLQSRYPEALLVVTTMTPTGSERVQSVFGDSVYHVYAPYDLPDALGRFFTKVHPSLLVIMETELWPNLIHQCDCRGIPVVLANARLSEKSAKGYGKFSGLTSPMLKSIRCVAAQNENDGARFLGLGLADKQLEVTGNIKFDVHLDDGIKTQANQLKTQWQGDCLGVETQSKELGIKQTRPIFLAASTHRGEDQIILQSFEKIRLDFPELLLVLVPRHPERFDEVAELCLQRGLSVCWRSADTVPSSADQVLLGDTMGELLLFFGACDIAFVGGSLVPVGGHNLIEPAMWAVPVLSGPHLFNFSEASQLLLDAGGMRVCEHTDALAEQVVQLLQDNQLATTMGSAAQSVTANNRGALDKLLAIIERQLSSQ